MPLRPLLLAAGMLTIVRVPVSGRVSGAEMRRSTAFYPLVGLAVGLVPALALLAPLPPESRAALALGGWVLVTGALHLDGWADCCDAALAPAREEPERMRERRLAILKDPHVGTFGAAGIVLLLLGKWTALLGAAPLAPLVAAPAARWAMVAVLRLHPPARPDGLGAAHAGAVPLGWAALCLAGVLALVLALLPEGSLWLGALTVAGLGIAAALALGAWLAHRFGGVTGDVCGAVGEAAELLILWGFLAW